MTKKEMQIVISHAKNALALGAAGLVISASSLKDKPTDDKVKDRKEHKKEISITTDSISSQTPENSLVAKAGLNFKVANERDELAFAQSLTFVSTMTEASPEVYENPAAVATGNGYYGQNQLSIGNAKKYIAYALANGCDKDVKDAYKQFFVGNSTDEGKQRIDKALNDFINVMEKKDANGVLEEAFSSNNKELGALVGMISSSGFVNKWKKVHNQIPENVSSKYQSGYICQVYAQNMGSSIKDLQKKYKNINFAQIHPAVLSAFLAVSIKTGNGGRIDESLSQVKDVKQINSKKFLEKFCCPENGAKYRKVYLHAVKALSKNPTADTFYEMGVLLKNQNLLQLSSDLESRPSENVIAWNEVAKPAIDSSNLALQNAIINKSKLRS